MTVYNNPIVLQRADPWVLKVDGEYWFTASDPEYDKIAIRHASTINDLQKAPETVVWRKHESGVCSKYIWAPELHRVNGAWYIYFAGAEHEFEPNVVAQQGVFFLERIVRRDHHPNLLQAGKFDHVVGDDHVARVNRVECAEIESDFHLKFVSA